MTDKDEAPIPEEELAAAEAAVDPGPGAPSRPEGGLDDTVVNPKPCASMGFFFQTHTGMRCKQASPIPVEGEPESPDKAVRTASENEIEMHCRTAAGKF